jgi:hypothetical protein
MDKILTERIIKAVVNWNGQHIDFDKKFLEFQDYTELIIIDNGDIITLTTKMK